MPTYRIMAALALLSTPLAAQQIKMELPDSLVSQAKITEAAARKIAIARVPKGSPTAVELERENGHLQYSYDFAVPGDKQVTEVNIDALTGKVIAVQKE